MDKQDEYWRQANSKLRRPLTEAEMAALTPEEREEEIAGLRAGALRRLKARRLSEATKGRSKTS